MALRAKVHGKVRVVSPAMARRLRARGVHVEDTTARKSAPPTEANENAGTDQNLVDVDSFQAPATEQPATEQPEPPPVNPVEMIDEVLEQPADVAYFADLTARVAIAGGPRCGKTTLASALGVAPVRHTDDLISKGWSEASAEAATWFDETGPWIIEGVAVPRALRKWLAAHPDGKPCDIVYWLDTPHTELTKGQRGMLRGCETVWREIVGELERRGVEIRSGE